MRNIVETQSTAVPPARPLSPPPKSHGRKIPLNDDIYERVKPKSVKIGVNVEARGKIATAIDRVTEVLFSACRRLWFWSRSIVSKAIHSIKSLFTQLLDLLTSKSRKGDLLLNKQLSNNELSQAVDICVKLNEQMTAVTSRVALSPAEQQEFTRNNETCKAQIQERIRTQREFLDALNAKMESISTNT